MKDQCSRNAIEVTERFCEGMATLEEVRSAATAVAASAASDAAYASAYAAYAAAYATTTTYARTKTLAKCAVLVRKRLKVQDIR